MQEVQANATQQVEAIMLAVATVMGGKPSEGGDRKPQTADELTQGLAAFMRQGG